MQKHYMTLKCWDLCSSQLSFLVINTALKTEAWNVFGRNVTDQLAYALERQPVLHAQIPIKQTSKKRVDVFKEITGIIKSPVLPVLA